MPRSPLLYPACILVSGLLALSGCSAGQPISIGTTSTASAKAHGPTSSDEGDEEDKDDEDATKPLDPLEYGNCTSSEIRDYDDDLTDNDEEDNRAQAEAQVTKVVPASDQVDITGDDLSADRVVKISAGARDVTITSTNLVVIIEGEIESLTVRGFDNTIWIDASNKVTFGSSDGDNLNYVFWSSGPPQSKVDPQGLNVIGKDAHAPVIRSCRVFS